MVKNPPAMWETFRSLGWEDPLVEGIATHSSVLAWRVPMDRGAWRAAVHGVAKGWTQLSEHAQHIRGHTGTAVFLVCPGSLWTFPTEVASLFGCLIPNTLEEKYATSEDPA